MPYITNEIVNAYNTKGFAIIPDVLSEGELEAYRKIFDQCVRDKDADFANRGISEEGITLKGKRYFIGFPYLEYPDLGNALFNDKMAEITRAILGDRVYLYWDQCVIKYKDEQSSFAWHQDSGYGPVKEHLPYLTCWIALDDVNEENGTVYMLPYDRAGTRERVEHTHCDKAKALVGYHGDDPGDPVIMKAGSIAVFSSHTFHHSSANSSGAPRRVYYSAFSKELIYRKDTEEETVYGHGKPFLENGKRVDDYLEVEA